MSLRSNLFNVFILLLQIGFAFIASFSLYMLAVLYDSDWGFDGLIGLGFHAIWGSLISVGIVIVCLIIGLPIRLITKFNNWWVRHFYLTFITSAIGLTLIILSLTSSYIENFTGVIDEVEYTKSIPNTILSISGWIVIVFSVLHTYPPLFIRDQLRRLPFFNNVELKIE